jgi:HSP20 family molecular chaperone IbpA
MTANDVLIELELPPLVDDELEVTLLDHRLAVSGRAAGSVAFRTELELPSDADVEHLTATLRHGSLELHAPKQPPRLRRISVHRPCRLGTTAWAD